MKNHDSAEEETLSTNSLIDKLNKINDSTFKDLMKAQILKMEEVNQKKISISGQNQKNKSKFDEKADQIKLKAENEMKKVKELLEKWQVEV